MQGRRLTTFAAWAVALFFAGSQTSRAEAPVYPPAPKSDTVDVYHGVSVPDPFRPLEDPDAPETRKWVEAENRVTFAHLEKIAARPRIKARLTQLWNYERYSQPIKEGGRYFLSHNTGLQNQGVIETLDALDAPPRVLLDPNTLSADGTVALTQGGLVPSQDGKLLAYGLAGAGSDWVEWKVRDVATGKDLDDHLKWIKFSSVSWTPDNRGFFYGRFPEPKPGEDLKGANYNQALYYHKLGDPQTADALVFARPDHKEWTFHADVTEDGDYLVVTTRRSTSAKHTIFLKKLGDADAKVEELVGDFSDELSLVGSDGPRFWFVTDRGAPRRRIVSLDVRKPAEVKEVVPEAKETMVEAHLVGDRLIGVYLKDARSVVKVFETDGAFVRDVDLPGIGSIDGFEGRRKDGETFYAFTAYAKPTTIYRYDVATGQSREFRAPKLAFNPDDYETKQDFYTSKDGTRVPIFLSYKKGTKLDSGAAPTLLYGYGGFNIPMVPTFSAGNLAWMEMGGVYAVANLRGGGEYGEEWHRAGTKLRKQNVFDDFIAAAEWLIEKKVTSTPKLAIEGRSNGGLLVGAVLNQRPDLFGAALPGVGVMDMLRFHKFTIGWAWVDDFGSSDDAEEFRAIRAYSPLHTIKRGRCYPPTLVTTADHDDRVVPAHSFKYAATLQAAQGCANPVLIRIETQAGHGAGKPTAKLIDDVADKWAFVVDALHMAVPDR